VILHLDQNMLLLVGSEVLLDDVRRDSVSGGECRIRNYKPVTILYRNTHRCAGNAKSNRSGLRVLGQRRIGPVTHRGADVIEQNLPRATVLKLNVRRDAGPIAHPDLRKSFHRRRTRALVNALRDFGQRKPDATDAGGVLNSFDRHPLEAAVAFERRHRGGHSLELTRILASIPPAAAPPPAPSPSPFRSSQIPWSQAPREALFQRFGHR